MARHTRTGAQDKTSTCTYPVRTDTVKPVGRRGAIRGKAVIRRSRVDGVKRVLELRPASPDDGGAALVGAKEQVHLHHPRGLDPGHSHTPSLGALGKGSGTSVGTADVGEELRLGLRALDAGGDLDPVLELGLVGGIKGRPGLEHEADRDVLDGQVLDVAEEAVLDPGVAAPVHLLEGQLVVDRVDERPKSGVQRDTVRHILTSALRKRGREG